MSHIDITRTTKIIRKVDDFRTFALFAFGIHICSFIVAFKVQIFIDKTTIVSLAVRLTLMHARQSAAIDAITKTLSPR